MDVTITEDGNIIVRGNQCPIGEKYVRDEIRNPKRVVCTVVRIEGAKYPVLPVRTDGPIPMDKICELIEMLRDFSVKAPVKRGQVLIENLFGTGVNLIAERTMEAVGND